MSVILILYVNIQSHILIHILFATLLIFYGLSVIVKIMGCYDEIFFMCIIDLIECNGFEGSLELRSSTPNLLG